MIYKKELPEDDRIHRIVDLLLKYARLDFGSREVVSEKGDEVDAVIVGLNTLGEELEFYGKTIEEYKERTNALLDILLGYMLMNFSKKASISDKGDEIDAIALGLNTLGEEIEQLMLTEKKYREKLEKANNELTALTTELKRSNDELSQFAYVASHDLQEPLRMVSSYVNLLKDQYKDKLDNDANEFIDFAVDGSNRMRNLIRGLLEFSRINRSEKVFEETDLNTVIFNVLKNLHTSIKETNAIIHYDVLPVIKTDNLQMEQLFQNLISNAIKFIGKEPPEIKISSQPIAGGYLFSINDKGIGIAPQYANRIFLIFQRLHSKQEYPGTGIGLALCKKIVERHNGKIWVESEPGKGTTFFFTIKT